LPVEKRMANTGGVSRERGPTYIEIVKVEEKTGSKRHGDETVRRGRWLLRKNPTPWGGKTNDAAMRDET